MNKIKFLKANMTTGKQKIQLNGLTYKPYTICELAGFKNLIVFILYIFI